MGRAAAEQLSFDRIQKLYHEHDRTRSKLLLNPFKINFMFQRSWSIVDPPHRYTLAPESPSGDP